MPGPKRMTLPNRFLVLAAFISCSNSHAFSVEELDSYVTQKSGCHEQITQHSFSNTDGIQYIEKTLYRDCIKDICVTNTGSRSVKDEVYQDYAEDKEKLQDQFITPYLDNIFNQAEETAKQALKEMAPNEKERLSQIAAIQDSFQMLYIEKPNIFSRYWQTANSRPDLSEEERIQLFSEVQYNYLSENYSPSFAKSAQRLDQITHKVDQQALTQTDEQFLNNGQNNINTGRFREKLYRLPDSMTHFKIYALNQLNIYELRMDKREEGISLSTGLKERTIPEFIISLLLNKMTNLAQDTDYLNLLENLQTAYRKLPEYKKIHREESLPHEIQRNLQDLRAKCEEKLKLNLKGLATNNKLEKGRNSIEKAREQFIASLNDKRLYSKKSTKMISNYLADLDILLPPSRETYLSTIQDMSQRNSNLFQRTTPKTQVLSALDLNGGLHCQSILHYDQANYYRHGKNLEKNKVVLSTPATANFEQIGKPVLFHELAHAVSGFLRDKNASRTSQDQIDHNLSCQGKAHVKGNFLKRILSTPVEQFQEEDYADALSATLLPTQRNFACVMTENFTPITTDQNAETTARPGAHHSSAVFRLINWQKNAQRPLPQSCRDALKKEQVQFSFRSDCFPSVDDVKNTTHLR